MDTRELTIAVTAEELRVIAFALENVNAPYRVISPLLKKLAGQVQTQKEDRDGDH